MTEKLTDAAVTKPTLEQLEQELSRLQRVGAQLRRLQAVQQRRRLREARS